MTDEGALYAWGANSYGQLGTGNKANSCTPTKVGEDLGRIVEVSATHYNHISAALTQDSRCYMWGQCRGQSVVSPTETPFTSLHDVFACFATPSVTFVPMETEVTNGPSVYDSLKLAFDDPQTSDVRFLVRMRERKQEKSHNLNYPPRWRAGKSMHTKQFLRFAASISGFSSRPPSLSPSGRCSKTTGRREQTRRAASTSATSPTLSTVLSSTTSTQTRWT